MICIAVFLNNSGQTASLAEEGFVKVFVKKNNQLTEQDSIPFAPGSSKSLVEFRSSIIQMVRRLGSCRVFIAKEVIGQLYSVLEANLFNIYEIDGRPEKFLDSIFNIEEIDAQNLPSIDEKPSDDFYPQKTGTDGNYFVNLKTLLESDPALSSKQVLLPFLAKASFNHLEVVCSHIPRWFDEELGGMGLYSSIVKANDGEYNVMVYRKN